MGRSGTTRVLRCAAGAEHPHARARTSIIIPAGPRRGLPGLNHGMSHVASTSGAAFVSSRASRRTRRMKLAGVASLA